MSVLFESFLVSRVAMTRQKRAKLILISAGDSCCETALWQAGKEGGHKSWVSCR